MVKNIENARIQYLEKLFSQKQQKVSLLTGFKQMNPLSAFVLRETWKLFEREEPGSLQVFAISKHKQ